MERLCQQCGLHIYSDPPCIKGGGPTPCKVMIINSLPGDLDENEGRATIPNHLKKQLQEMGLEEVYYTNAIKCRTPKEYKIKVGEINKCKYFLQKEISKVKPQYILLMGAQALKATIGGSITTLNGVVVEKDGIKYLPSYNPGIIYRDPSKAPQVQQAMNNFKSLVTTGDTPQLPQLNLHILTTRKQVIEAFEKLKGQCISYDIETTGVDRFNCQINLLGFGNTQVQYIIPLQAKYGPLRGRFLAQKRLVKQAMKCMPLAKSRAAGNGKFDNNFLEHYCGLKPFLDFDVVLASHCLNENSPNGVKENAILELNVPNWDIPLEHKKGNYKTHREYEEYVTYLGYDIFFEAALAEHQKKKLREDKSLGLLFKHLYMPVARAYEETEMNGVAVYEEKFKVTEKKLNKELQRVIRKLDRYKKGVNWNSPQQVGTFLYQDLKLPVLERTETGAPSTGESVLKRLRDKHKAVELLLEYRGKAIQISHFVDGWKSRMVDWRIHPVFKLYGTVTGRTSCTNPNLQQVPRSKNIRSQLGTHRDGWFFVEIDLSQAELRITAIISGEPTMIRIYQTGGDIHHNTYVAVTGKEFSDVPSIKKEERKKAKATNFGFVYGMGWSKYQEYARDNYEIIVSQDEAKDTRKAFFNTYSKLPAWHDRQRKIVRQLKKVRSPIGRIRRLPDIDSNDKGKRAEAERQGINSPVQGFASDITLLGYAEIMQYSRVYHKHLRLNKSRFRGVGTVHDALLFEVEGDYLEEFVWKAKKIVENSKALSSIFKFTPNIPIIADVTVGRGWGDGEEIDFDKNWKEQIAKIRTRN